MNIFTIAYRNVFRNKRRSLLAGLAIFIVAIMFIFLFGIIDGFKKDLTYNIYTYMAGEVRMRHKDFDKYELLNPLSLGIAPAGEIINQVAGMDNIRILSPRVRFQTGIYREGKTYTAQGIGVDFEQEKMYQDLNKYLVSGRIPVAGEKEVLMAEGLAKEVNVGIDDKVTFFAQTRGRGSNAFTLKVVGLIKFPVAGFNNNLFLAPLDRIQYYLRMGDSITEICIKLKNHNELEKFVNSVRSMINKNNWVNIEAKSWKEIGPYYTLMMITDITYNYMTFIFFFLGCTVIIGVTIMIVYERTKEIGTLSAIGMSTGEIIKLFFLESLIIGVISTVAGVIVGIGITLPISYVGLDFSSYLGEFALEISPVFYPVINIRYVLIVLFYGILVTAISSFLPARKVAKVEPVEALREIN